MTQTAMDVEARPLPPGWKWVKLGDVCENSETTDPKKSPERLFTYIDISRVDRNKKRVVSPDSVLGKDAPSRARRVVKNGDILVSTTRPNLNAVALIDSSLDGAVCSTGFCVLRPKRTAIPNYIFHFVKSEGFIQSLSGLVSGALYPAVTDNQVYQQDIPLPPLKEQKRIATILNEQMAVVEKASKAAEERLDAAKALPDAYLRQVFESEESENWGIKRLSDICEKITVGHVGPTQDGYITRTGVPFLRTQNVERFQIDLSDALQVSQDFHRRLKKSQLKSGDLIVVRVGGKA